MPAFFAEARGAGRITTHLQDDGNDEPPLPLCCGCCCCRCCQGCCVAAAAIPLFSPRTYIAFVCYITASSSFPIAQASSSFTKQSLGDFLCLGSNVRRTRCRPGPGSTQLQLSACRPSAHTQTFHCTVGRPLGMTTMMNL